MSDHDPDEEIESSRAPLLDHLIELRKRLIISVAALVVGFIVCFAFSRQIYIFLLHPFEVGADFDTSRVTAALGVTAASRR